MTSEHHPAPLPYLDGISRNRMGFLGTGGSGISKLCPEPDKSTVAYCSQGVCSTAGWSEMGINLKIRGKEWVVVLTTRPGENQLDFEQVYNFCGPLFFLSIKMGWMQPHSQGYHVCLRLETSLIHSRIFTRQSFLPKKICGNALRHLFCKFWDDPSSFGS